MSGVPSFSTLLEEGPRSMMSLRRSKLAPVYPIYPNIAHLYPPKINAPDLIPLIEESCPHKTDTVLYARWITHDRHGKTNKRKALVIDELHVTLFQEKSLTAKLQVEKQQVWTAINTINLVSPFQLVLKFTSGKIEIFDGSVLKIFTVIMNHVLNILLPSEMPVIKAQGTDIPKRSHLAAVRRFRYLQLLRNESVSEDLGNSIFTFVESKISKLDVSQFTDSIGHESLIYDTFLGEKSIETLVIYSSALRTQPTSDIAAFLLNNGNIKTIEFKGILNDWVAQLTTCFNEDSPFSVENILVDTEEITLEQVQILSKIIENFRVTSASITGFTSDETYSKFITQMTTNPQTTCVTQLGINSFQISSLEPTFKTFNHLKTLRLPNCNIEVAHVLQAITSDLQLEQVDLQGNKFIEPLQAIDFPKTLSQFVLSNIECAKGNLEKLFVLLVPHYPITDELSLDLSSLRMTEDSWNDFFERIGSVNYPTITTLNWNRNPLHKCFFCYVHFMPTLDKLTLDYCLSPQTPAAIEMVSEFVMTNHMVKYFSMLGDKEHRIDSDSICKIFESLGYNRRLKAIDVTGHPVNDKCFKALSKSLLDNRVIIRVSFGSDGDYTFAGMEDLASALRERGRKIDLPWHGSKVKKFCNQGYASQMDVVRLKKAWEELGKDKRTKKLPKDSISRRETRYPSFAASFKPNAGVTRSRRNSKKMKSVKKEAFPMPLIDPEKDLNSAIEADERHSIEVLTQRLLDVAFTNTSSLF